MIRRQPGSAREYGPERPVERPERPAERDGPKQSTGRRSQRAGADRKIASSDEVSGQCTGLTLRYRRSIGPKAWPIPSKRKLIPKNPKAEHTRAARASKSGIKPTPRLGLTSHVYITTRPAEEDTRSADVKPILGDVKTLETHSATLGTQGGTRGPERLSRSDARERRDLEDEEEVCASAGKRI